MVHDHVHAYRFHFALGQLCLRRFFFGTMAPAALYSIFESYFPSKFHRCFNKRFGQNLCFSYSIISFDEGSGISKEIGGRSTKNRQNPSFLARVMSILNLLKNLSLPAHYYVPRACLLYTSPSPRDGLLSRMPSSA